MLIQTSTGNNNISLACLWAGPFCKQLLWGSLASSDTEMKQESLWRKTHSKIVVEGEHILWLSSSLWIDCSFFLQNFLFGNRGHRKTLKAFHTFTTNHFNYHSADWFHGQNDPKLYCQVQRFNWCIWVLPSPQSTSPQTAWSGMAVELEPESGGWELQIELLSWLTVSKSKPSNSVYGTCLERSKWLFNDSWKVWNYVGSSSNSHWNLKWIDVLTEVATFLLRLFGLDCYELEISAKNASISGFLLAFFYIISKYYLKMQILNACQHRISQA